MRVGVIGLGALGARAARQLVSSDGVGDVALYDVDGDRARAVAASLVHNVRVADGPLPDRRVDVVVLATPAGTHRTLAERALERGAAVVSAADSVEDVRGLLALDAEARERDLPVVVGAGVAPGLTDVLARHAAAGFDVVDEVHVAKAGTAGPACARQHHRALGGTAIDWRDGAWQERTGLSGRELCWFPDPIGARDCYRGALPDALLLVPVFPGVSRVTARVAATRRDRITAGLPMLRRPHPEGLVGAVRVEVRGRQGPAHEVTVLGAMDRPGVAAGTVASLAALAAGRRELAPGAGGLGALVEPVPFLAELARRGVRCAVFEGATATVA